MSDDPMYEVPLSRLQEMRRMAERIVELEKQLGTAQSPLGCDNEHCCAVTAQASATQCTLPPAGWTCSRGDRHEGPCAATAQSHASVATAQSPAGPDFLTDDERRFFAYMAQQRFRTVAEKDPQLRERARDRWREVALWFDPSWTG